jgi:hypothetical protein
VYNEVAVFLEIAFDGLLRSRLIGIAILLAGTTIAVKWDDVVVALRGKRLAVLGARGVGKTS